MKYLIFFLGFFIANLCTANVDQMRTLFFASTNNEGIKKFYTQAQTLDESQPILKAYKGVATAMYAGVADKVSDKLDYFSKGKALLEAAIVADWYNPEIRFLRFSVQCEVPFFVGYSGELNGDSKIVLNALKAKSIDSTIVFWKKAIAFMIESGELTGDVQNELEKLKI
jgi:hypothetical protein